MKALLAFVLATATCVCALAEDTYKVDPAETSIVWVVKKITQNGEHTGTVKVKSGSFGAKSGVINAGEMVIDMSSITCTDITDKEENLKFIGHITSPDFFEIKKYPESKLVIQSVKKTANGQELSGAFTIIGQTRPLTFTATDVKIDGKILTATTSIVFDRTKWGLRYGSRSFFKGLGDKAINNEFMLKVTIKASK